MVRIQVYFTLGKRIYDRVQLALGIYSTFTISIQPRLVALPEAAAWSPTTYRPQNHTNEMEK